MSSTEVSTPQTSSIEDEIIEKFTKQNEVLHQNLQALEKSHDNRMKSFQELLNVYESKQEANFRSLKMLQQRQEIGEQKIKEMEYLVQLLKLRARQMGIGGEESDSGSDEVFDDESDCDENEE